MSNLIRDPVKHVRDRAKSRYKKGSECRICGEQENLDFHHFYSMTELLNKWLRSKGLVIKTDEDIIAVRDEYIAEHEHELFDATVTLCHTHHLKLHSIYGKNPSLATAKKQERWVEIQREKNGLVE